MRREEPVRPRHATRHGATHRFQKGSIKRSLFRTTDRYVGLDHRVGHFRPLRMTALIREYVVSSIVKCFRVA
jgi:hypothetical protein